MKPRVREEIARRRDLERDRAARLARWAAGEQPGPFKVMYFPTNVCNLECAICWQRKGVHDYSELPVDRQERLLDEAIALGVRELVLGGGGEPLARWTQLEPLMRRARAAGMYGMLFTNGTLIRPRVAQALVDMRWNKVLISLDGLAQVNDDVREPGSFRRILRGLDTLLEARGDETLPVIGVGTVMTREGARDLPDLMRLLAERDCEQLNLIRLVVHLEGQRRFSVSSEEMTAFGEALREAKQVADEAGIVTNLGEYTDADLVARTESFEDVLVSDRTHATSGSRFWGALCFEPFSNLVVHANGMVGPCCMSGDDPVTSIASRSLQDVWYGAEFSRLRTGILSRKPEPYCRTCDLNVFAENQRLRVLGQKL